VAQAAIFSIVVAYRLTVTPMQETAQQKCPQAVIERGSDAKIVERRGEVY
jgi:hypothetical protein